MKFLDLDAFGRAPLISEPFDFVLVPDFLRHEALSAVLRDFPRIAHAGLLPLAETSGGSGFQALIDELRSGEVESAFAAKFGLDLSGRPLMVTVRGRCQEKDGRIHTDSESKLLTALLYVNEPWQAAGGRLRLLRGPHDLDDMIVEVPPDGGTLVAFRRSERSFHGHKPFVGVRRYVMLNWMTGKGAAERELARHHLSARAKQLASGFLGGGRK